MKLQHLLTLALTATLVAAAPATAATTSYALNGGVENIQTLKDQITAYYTSGRQEADVARVDAHLRAYVASRLKQGVKKPAVVFDVDDTLLSGFNYEKTYDFGYSQKTWNAYEQAFKMPAMAPSLQLVKWLLSQNVAVFFVTGRRVPQTALTAAELKAAGFPAGNGLYLRPVGDHAKSVIPFKSGARQKIEAQGYTVLAAIGDQWSDSLGGFTEREYKLPNPMYYVP
jgi:predicted secreted acid phosphatase